MSLSRIIHHSQNRCVCTCLWVIVWYLVLCVLILKLEVFWFFFSASELVTEDGLSSPFIEYIEGTRLVEH